MFISHSAKHMLARLDYPLVIEILTRMSYIFRSGKDLSLGSSGLSLQASCLRADVKSSMIDNGRWLAKGLPGIPCVIEIVLGFGRARNSSGRAKFQSPMMLMIGVVYLDTLLRWVNEHLPSSGVRIETCLAHCSSYVHRLNVKTGQVASICVFNSI
jgi:hypothetical protein